MYVEFSPDDRFLLASVSVQRQNFDASAIVCNSKTGTVLLIVQDLFLNVFATWYSNSWIVTSYFYGTLGGLFIITILDVGNIKEGTCINQSVHMYQSKVDVVCVMFDYHNIRQLQHCRIIRPRQHQTVLFCQLNMDDVDHFASVKIASDANSKPLTHRQGNDVMESPQDQFDGIVALDHHSHACGIVLSRDESKLIASVVTERLEAVKLCIYDVVTLQLLHTLPSDNMARPSSSYYLFPSVTEEVITCGSDSGIIHIWDWTNGTEIGQIHGHKGICSAVTFCPGRPHVMASAGDDHTVRIWRFQPTATEPTMNDSKY